MENKSRREEKGKRNPRKHRNAIFLSRTCLPLLMFVHKVRALLSF